MSTKTILGALALAITGASAAEWRLAETYDKTNFFDKFDFFTGADPTFGHVNYRTRADATEMGLVGVDGDDVFMRPETSSVAGDEGRSSVRIESKTEYDYGLFIARFSKVPTPTCGVWPAFWTYGEPWVEVGEVDILEQWNDAPQNAPAFHTGRSDEFGVCTIDQSDMRGSVLTSNCDNYHNNPPEQYEYQGCTASDDAGPWGTSEAGVYAMEWTTEFLKLYSFSGANVPTNIDSETPDTASWGKPTMMLRNDLCDIDGHFARQKLVFNINFCGNPGGEEHGWKVESECAAKTGYDTCAEYVGSEPGDFVDAFYKIRDIRVFEQGKGGGEGSDERSGEETSAAPTESKEKAQPTAEPTVCDSYECEDAVTESENPTPVESESPQASEPTCEGESCPEEPAATTESSSPETTEDCETSIVEPESPQPTEPSVCEGGECAQEPAATTEGSSPETTEDCEEETMPVPEAEVPTPEAEEPAPVESESPPPAEHENEVPEVVTPCDGYECEGEPAPEHEVPAPEEPAPEAEEPAPVESESRPPAGHEDEVPEFIAPCDGYECEGEPAPEPEVPAPAPEEPEAEEPVPGCTGPECPVPEHPAPEHPAPEHPAPEHPAPEHPAPEHPVPEHPVESSPPHPEEPVHQEPAPGCTGPECDGYTEQPEEHVPEPEESSSPVVEEPVVDEPVGEIPVGEEPVGEEPVADDGSYGEPPVEEPVGEEPAPGCVGPECDFAGNGTATDIPGSVPTGPVEVIGAGVKGGVSLLAALVAVFAL